MSEHRSEFVSSIAAERIAYRGDYIMLDHTNNRFVVMTASQRDARLDERTPFGTKYRYTTWTRKQ
jgi:hypothetical protein